MSLFRNPAPDADSGKTEWTGISSLNHFTLEKNGLRGRRYGSIGEGIFVDKTSLKPIKGTFNFDEEAGFLASNIGSMKEEREAVLSGGVTKFWYHPHCTKTVCVKEEDVVTDVIEEDVPVTEIGDLYACPEPGCSAVFLKFFNLEKHVLRGKHKKSPERVTERDFAVNLFAHCLEGVNESKTFPTVVAALKELRETKENKKTKQGWALPGKRQRKAFDEDVKKFLIECFNEGLNSKSVLSPFAINKRMRTARKPQGGKRFSMEQLLSVPQIASFLSREAVKRRSASTAVSSCNRRRRHLRRPSHHRRRRNVKCQKDKNKEQESMIPVDEHEDSGWIEFMKNEEFWTLADEFHGAVIEKFDEIFEKESEKMDTTS